MFHTRCIQSYRHKAQRVLSQHRRYYLLATCPPPTCNCLPTPTGLDIDHKLPLEGTVPPYDGQVLISTGKSDWTSRIEDDKTGALARELKRLLGPKGKYFNVSIERVRGVCSPYLTSPSRTVMQFSPALPFQHPVLLRILNESRVVLQHQRRAKQHRQLQYASFRLSSTYQMSPQMPEQQRALSNNSCLVRRRLCRGVKIGYQGRSLC